jgi:uridine kinase
VRSRHAGHVRADTVLDRVSDQRTAQSHNQDIELLCSTLRKLKNGERVQVPVYDFSKHARAEETVAMYGANVVILEGVC